MPPVLLALETRLKLVSLRGARELPLEQFFLDYRKTALAPDEVIESLTMPRLWPGEVFLLRQGEQAARPGHLHRGGRLSPAHQAREDRECAAGLRRHGGDPQARRQRRGGAPELGLRRRGGGAHGRLPADRRLARQPANIVCRWRPTCCAGWSLRIADPARAARGRSAMSVHHLAASRQRAEACHRSGDLYRRHARAGRHACMPR